MLVTNASEVLTVLGDVCRYRQKVSTSFSCVVVPLGPFLGADVSYRFA